MTDWLVGTTVRPGTPQFNQLVEAVIWQESRGNPNAVSHAGAAGLMQIMPDTARSPGFGVRPMDWNQRFNAAENRRFGTEYLAALLNRYNGNVERALAAYNWGAGRADNWNGNRASLPTETQGYIRNIMGGARGPTGESARAGSPEQAAGYAANDALHNTSEQGGFDSRRAAFEANMASLANVRNMNSQTPFSQPGLKIGQDAGQSRVSVIQPLQGVQLNRLFE